MERGLGVSLTGNLETFSLSEVLQLIAHQGKTGVLEIETGQGTARLRFLEGRLVEAWPDRRSPAELIGALLIRAGVITPTQLAHALERQRRSLKRLGDILVSMGVLRLRDFQEILALQHRETVYQLLTLKRGRFRFKDEPVELEEGAGVPMDVGELLMEGFRQIDEWPRVRERIPSDRVVMGRVAGAPVPADLTDEERRVLGLVDGVATVQEVADRARLGRFRGLEILADLYDRGLVQPVGAGRVRRTEPVRPAPKGRWLDAAVAGLLLLAAAGMVLLGAGGLAGRAAGTVTVPWEDLAAVRQEWSRALAGWSRPVSVRWPPVERARTPGGPSPKGGRR